MSVNKKYTPEFVLKELNIMLHQAVNEPEILFINQLFINKEYSRQRFSEWKKNFASNNEISDTIKRVEDSLETKIVIGALNNKLNPTMAIFTLKNKYNWSNQPMHEQTFFSDTIRFKAAKYID